MKKLISVGFVLLSIFLMYLAFYIMDYIFINPYVGGETHRLFNRPGGISYEVAVQVVFEYVVLISLIVALFVYLRYPSNWIIYAGTGCSIIIIRWYKIQYFLRDKEYHGLFAIATFIGSLFIIISIAAAFSSLLRSKRSGKGTG